MYIPASTSLNRSAIMRKERENSYKFDVTKKNHYFSLVCYHLLKNDLHLPLYN